MNSYPFHFKWFQYPQSTVLLHSSILTITIISGLQGASTYWGTSPNLCLKKMPQISAPEYKVQVVTDQNTIHSISYWRCRGSILDIVTDYICHQPISHLLQDCINKRVEFKAAIMFSQSHSMKRSVFQGVQFLLQADWHGLKKNLFFFV